MLEIPDFETQKQILLDNDYVMGETEEGFICGHWGVKKNQGMTLRDAVKLAYLEFIGLWEDDSETIISPDGDTTNDRYRKAKERDDSMTMEERIKKLHEAPSIFNEDTPDED